MFCNYTDNEQNPGCPGQTGMHGHSRYKAFPGPYTSHSSALTWDEHCLFCSGYFSASCQKRRKCPWCSPGHEDNCPWTWLISLRILNLCVGNRDFGARNLQHEKALHPCLFSTFLISVLQSDFSPAWPIIPRPGPIKPG